MPSAGLRSAGLGLQRFTWSVPEWPWILLAFSGWIGLAAHAGHRHPLSMAAWLAMVLAMMLPAMLPTARAVSFGSLWDRRYQAPALFVSAYVLIWAAFGAVALTAWWIAGFQHSIKPAVAAGAMLLVAAVWQLTPQHNRFLKRCHRTLPLGGRGYASDRACVRYGAYHGRQCVGSCWPLMLVMIPGHYLPELMVTLAALSTWERLARRPRRRACAAGLAGLAALTVLAGA